MTPQEYIGTDPYGKLTKMSKIEISNTSYLPLTVIKETGGYIFSMWMFSSQQVNAVKILHGSNITNINPDGSWQRFEMEFEFNVGDTFELMLPPGIYYIWHAQLEKGNKATDWSKAPEDIEEIANAYTNSKFEILDGKILSEVARVNGINEKVTKFEQNSEGFNWKIEEKLDNMKIGGTNLLSDTNVPSMIKKSGLGNKYLSDSENVEYSSGEFVKITDPPYPDFTHAYQFDCKLASSTATAGRSLTFYSGQKVPMVNGEVYTMSMYARKTSGDGKIRFMVGYTKYPNYNNYIEVTSEWKRYSYTFTYSDLDTGGTGGARCYFGASCAVVGVVQICGCKLEKGDKATDWCYSNADIKTAVNYMNLSDEGLIIGDIIGSDLNRNILIDYDSVDIRIGSEVLASYGENIVLRHDGKDVFTIKNSTFLDSVISEDRMMDDISYEGINHNDDGSIVSVELDSRTSTGRYLVANKIYVWHINALNRYAIFKVDSSCYVTKIYHYPSRPAFLCIITSNNTGLDVPCSYADGDAILDTIFKGNVWIDSDADVSGHMKSIPPLGIGTPGGEHMEIDNNEITSKIDDETPGVLYFNSEGGIVSINNNSTNAFRFNNGVLQSRYQLGVVSGTYSDWVDILQYGSNRTTIDGDDLIISSPKNIILDSKAGDVKCSSSVVIPNASSFIGTNTSGELINNFQPCDSNNDCVIGYGTYEYSEGNTNIYGTDVNIYTKGCVRSNRVMEVLYRGPSQVPNSGYITLSEKVSEQLNGIVLCWSYYNGTNAVNSNWQFTFIPKQFVMNAEGRQGVDVFLHTGSYFGRKYVYISDDKIEGYASNTTSDITHKGLTMDNNMFVLRFVYGV